MDPATPSMPATDAFKPPSASASTQLRREDSFASLTQSSSASGSQSSNKNRVIPSSDGEESSSDEDGLDDPFAHIPAPVRPRKPASNLKRELDDDVATPAPRAKTYKPKYSFEKIQQITEQDRALREVVKRSQALIASVENPTPEQEKEDKPVTLHAADTIMGKRGGRLLVEALNRVDVSRGHATWEFFDPTKKCINKNTRPFPSAAVEDSDVFVDMQDSSKREMMFLSGFFGDMADMGEALPREVLIWMLDQVCLNPKEDLAYAYYEVLRKPNTLRQLRDILSPPKISSLLELLGGTEEALDFDRQVKASQACPTEDRRWPFWNVKLLVQLLGERSDAYNSEKTRYLCATLVRIGLDERVSKQPEILAAVDDSITALLSQIPEEKWNVEAGSIGFSILSTIVLPQFRIRVLHLLPISSPRLHLFRRRLACAFLFEDGSYMTKPYKDLVRLESFVQLLRGSRFKIHDKTDFAALRWVISIMDVAIDKGATIGDVQEKDRGVDLLIDILKHMFSSIVDTSARDISRTEAKDAIERLQFRLVFSVRSRQKMALDVIDRTQSILPWAKPPVEA